MCSRKAASPTTSLGSLHPSLAAEWHPTKNGKLQPEHFLPFSNKKAWWRCPELPRSRVASCDCQPGGRKWVSDGAKARVVTSKTSLRAVQPGLAAQWHPIRNGDLQPDAVMPGSGKMVWWRCPVDESHEWRTSILGRVQHGSGCPICAGRNGNACYLAFGCPPLTSHPNGIERGMARLRLSKRCPGAGQKVWWRCSADPSHEWKATVSNRFAGKGCPMCSGRAASPSTSLRTLHPRLASEWHSERNGDLIPDRYKARKQQKRVWWRCSRNPTHEWQAVIASRVAGRGCPMCSGRTATPTTSLKAIKPTVAAEWHPTKNGHVTPEDVKASSSQEVLVAVLQR